MFEYFTHWLQHRLSLPLPGHEAQLRMVRNLHRPSSTEAPANAKVSSVLLLLSEENNEVAITLIVRTADGGVHSSQVAFPGGKREPTDIDAADTALREANEEINLDRNRTAVYGMLTPMYIPVSNFIVEPVVAVTTDIHHLEASPYEVAEIFHLTLSSLFDAKGDVEMTIHHPTRMKIKTPAYIINDQIMVWGATAMILAELEALWDEYNETLGLQ